MYVMENVENDLRPYNAWAKEKKTVWQTIHLHLSILECSGSVRIFNEWVLEISEIFRGIEKHQVSQNFFQFEQILFEFYLLIDELESPVTKIDGFLWPYGTHANGTPGMLGSCGVCKE